MISGANLAPMTEITLQKYLETHSQAEAAKVLGWKTQSAVSQALTAKREIVIRLNKRGLASSWYEIKKPKTKAA
jgi:DNA-directed RNA polymerase specialized sigma24 family protein